MAPQKSSVALVVLLVSTGCVLAQHPRIPIAPCSGAPMTASPTNRITTGATARLGGIPLPFVGTNNQPACPKIVSKQSRQSVGCNTNAGEVYTYSNTFPVLQIYPVTSVLVQWELLDHNRQKITCFTIPARIV
uniref:MD-2-related lipid-recognition domain-containing protein n=1 Tax=Daphnia galeata TaxID=27404 RepID=A0A8J2VYD1_9CRUS|nr:unnamed protein product [Daphnia galeata]